MSRVVTAVLATFALCAAIATWLYSTKSVIARERVSLADSEIVEIEHELVSASSARRFGHLGTLGPDTWRYTLRFEARGCSRSWNGEWPPVLLRSAGDQGIYMVVIEGIPASVKTYVQHSCGDSWHEEPYTVARFGVPVRNVWKQPVSILFFKPDLERRLLREGDWDSPAFYASPTMQLLRGLVCNPRLGVVDVDGCVQASLAQVRNIYLRQQ